jgi:hypothetical protein
VRLTQIFGEAGVLATQLLNFFFHRIALGLRSALPRSQSLEHSFSPLAPPIGQQRRVQTFAAEQSAQTTSRRRNNFSFFEDALLIFRGVGPPLWFGNLWLPKTQSELETRKSCLHADTLCRRN